MIKIKSLKGVHFDMIFDAFKAAFQDYEIQLNKAELQSMLNRRGFEPKLSFAAFKDDQIIAFTLNGIGTFNGAKTAYDTGTGTLKKYQGQGLASQIFTYSIPFLKEAGVAQYLLEVLQHNTKAISVYQKLGFKISREFNYFVKKMNDLNLNKQKFIETYKIKPVEISDCKSMSSFHDFRPSWQNSFDAISRDASLFKYLGAFKGNELLGYCIVEPVSGDITQIAVDKSHRHKGIATSLLAEALKFNQHHSMKIINTEIDCSSVNEFLTSNSISKSGEQFEMIKLL